MEMICSDTERPHEKNHSQRTRCSINRTFLVQRRGCSYEEGLLQYRMILNERDLGTEPAASINIFILLRKGWGERGAFHV